MKIIRWTLYFAVFIVLSATVTISSISSFRTHFLPLLAPTNRLNAKWTATNVIFRLEALSYPFQHPEIPPEHPKTPLKHPKYRVNSIFTVLPKSEWYNTCFPKSEGYNTFFPKSECYNTVFTVFYRDFYGIFTIFLRYFHSRPFNNIEIG